MRQIVLDTETTGLEVSQGHRIIEIGCVELMNRRLTGNHYHQYINPEREVDQGAIEVHGITNDFLQDKPLFAQIARDFLEFVSGAELIIHNAAFDIGFLNAELRRLDAGLPDVDAVCSVVDSLAMARKKHPGQRNTLDALCTRYMVDNSQRDLHGALLDSEILADVYLAMTGGQTMLTLSDQDGEGEGGSRGGEGIRRLAADRRPLPVIAPSAGELAAHEAQLEAIAASSGGRVLWRESAK
ncbi:DNA polymerase III subunit epsilon [Parahaliea aestuarii]|uniref:DNA polymerase III subunit epsilon n=1 Tax=Parahaliea aestuarii TaxID=1852021 RepID=A0A5C8ZRT4_9GAMM|nr:DNA polymerase III subunit epsilon [Parahaliea aestuarii]TXS91156.1 DNA polymerase III subunit epsilon [Parahaliea aestuarii]